MEITEIMEVLECLAQGNDPETGEVLAEMAPACEPRAIRALFGALQLLRTQPKRRGNSGKAWQVEDEARLAAGHAAGKSTAELGKDLQRSRGAVTARLVRLGLVDESEVGPLRYAV